ncbi:MAG: MerR family transcriptional regulator [Variovorax sp.]|nr:MerR family transcriptional regulator [Variovorax sp.]
MQDATDLSTPSGELLDEAALTLDELARACRVPPDWVSLHVEAGVLEARPAGDGQWRFASATLVRARRIAQVETAFDADPQLAALTADLIEEVARLRGRLRGAGLERSPR